MNQILKTGTNGVHGSLWEYNQPSNMVANDFFRNQKGQGRQITHFNQFGVTAGGPVVLPKVYNGRNKLFWFFAYDTAASKPAKFGVAFVTVPTAAERTGDFSALLPLGSQYQLYDPFSATLSGTTVVRSPYAATEHHPFESHQPDREGLLEFLSVTQCDARSFRRRCQQLLEQRGHGGQLQQPARPPRLGTG